MPFGLIGAFVVAYGYQCPVVGDVVELLEEVGYHMDVEGPAKCGGKVSRLLGISGDYLGRICDGARDAGDATGLLHSAQPCVLLRAYAAGRCLDLNGSEHGELLSDHVGRDGDGAPADEISATACEAELHGPAGARIRQLADLIAEEA